MSDYSQSFNKGRLSTQILKFSIPLMFSNLLQVLFHMADIAVVGRFSGSLALGSVGSTATLVTLFTGFLIGIAGGVNAIIARYMGAQDKQGIRELVHTSALLCAIIGLIIMVFGVTCARVILDVMNTKPELIDGATIYLQIYFLGMPGLAIFNFGNAVLSAAGDTKKPLVFLTISGVVNIILNLFFVIVCRLGVVGVALASIISIYISTTLIIRTLLTTKSDHGLAVRELKITPSRVKPILGIALPSGAQNAIFQFANLFVQVGVNHFSPTVVSGNSAAANADGVVYDVMAAVYAACTSFIGQNLGAGNRKRIMQSYYISLAYSFGVGVLLGLGFVLLGKQFLGLFATEPEVIEAGLFRLRIMGLTYCVSAFMDCTIAASRGLGKSVVPTVMVIIGSCLFRLLWIYTVFEHYQTITSLYLLYVFSWTLTAILEIGYFAWLVRKMGIVGKKNNII